MNRYYFCIQLVMCLLFSKQQIQAQDETRITPPSPNAAAYAKYGNIPVSTYTGTPNISIPLYNITVRDINIPISISYHASGIKVSEEASRVGLGWVINCGGVITRNIINLDDFAQIPQAFLNTYNNSPAIPQGPLYAPVKNVYPGTSYSYVNTLTGEQKVLDLSSYLLPTGIDPLYKEHDFEPDQYTFNFLNYSGSFVLNRNREAIIERKEKLRIRPITTDGSVWEITDAQGYVYRFADSEYVVNNGTTGYQERTAWYLSEIISPQGESVTFHYVTEQSKYIIPTGEFYERWSERTLSCQGFSCEAPPSYRHPIVGKSYSNISLDYIEWKHGKLKFNLEDDRLDIEGDKRLSSIQIYDATPGGSPIQEIKFLHDYFKSSSVGPYVTTEFPVQNPAYALKRLKLTSVVKRSLPDAPDKQPEQHFFTYNESYQMPPKNSFSKDHWGYANGKYANTSLIPKFKITPAVNGLNDIVGIMGPERDPAEEPMKALSLTSITYPTKGKTIFTYSPNDYDVGASSNNNNTNQPETYSQTIPVLYDMRKKGEIQSVTVDMRDAFVNSSGNTVPVELNAAFRLNGDCHTVVGETTAWFELYYPDGTRVSRVTPGSVYATCVPGSRVFTYKNQYLLAPGKYTWTAFTNASDAMVVDISAMYTYVVDAKKRPPSVSGDNLAYQIGGGIRIDRIEDYDPETTKRVNVRKFNYHYTTDLDDDGVPEIHSYGKRMVQPNYSYFVVDWQKRTLPQGATGTDLCLECIHLIRDSYHPLLTRSGNVVGYSMVTESLGENGENGFTTYEYENQEDFVRSYIYPYGTGDIAIRPAMNPTVKSDKNGLLKIQTTYNSSHLPVYKVVNRWESKWKDVVYGIEGREIGAYGGVLTGGSNILFIPNETLVSTFPYLAESTEAYYDINGNETTKINSKYSYDNKDHLQLTEQSVEKSNLHKTLTTYTYPSDYEVSESTPVITAMKGEKHMQSLPVEITTFDVDQAGAKKIKNRLFNIYDYFGDKIFKKEVVVLENDKMSLTGETPSYIPTAAYNDQLYKKKISLEYNSQGNLSKNQKVNDTPSFFLWGYGQTLMTASIRNATAGQCYFTSFEEDGSLWIDTDGVSLAKTGKRVKNASVFSFPTTYTPVVSNTLMSYWYYKNNEWLFSGVVPFQPTISTDGTKLDEIRAFPKGSVMTTYCYEPLIGLISQTDANNNSMYYEYDYMQRLKLIRDQQGKIVKTYSYGLKK